MSASGYQPVCVMYQGNGSALDGTCRLVCRHEIREEDFLQDDIVHVENLGRSGNKECLQAVVMGDELVASLLRSIYPIQPLQTSNKFSTKRKRREEQEEEETASSKNTECLHEILSTVRDIKRELLSQRKEMSQIKQRQFHVETRIGLLQEQMTMQGRTTPDARQRAPVEQSFQEVVRGFPTPCRVEVIAEQEAPVQEWHVIEEQQHDENDDNHSNTHSLPMDEEFVYKQEPHHEELAGQQHEGTSVGHVMHNDGYLSNILKSAQSQSSNILRIGNEEFSIKLSLHELEDMLYRSSNPTNFAYRMAGKCFTNKEMLEGNTRGGGKRADGREYKQLNPAAVTMILAEVQKRFPYSGNDKVLIRCVKNAINERARNERKKQRPLVGKVQDSPPESPSGGFYPISGNSPQSS